MDVPLHDVESFTSLMFLLLMNMQSTWLQVGLLPGVPPFNLADVMSGRCHLVRHACLWLKYVFLRHSSFFGRDCGVPVRLC